MKKLMTRFGEVEYDPEQVLRFPAGMIGFEGLRDFLVMPNEKEGPLFWIQSIDDPGIAFVLTDPSNFFFDYQVVPDNRERKILGITEKDDCHVLAVVTVPTDRKITLNLAAPVLFAPKSNLAMQVILEGTRFQSRTPLPPVEQPRRSPSKQKG